jgi:signal transduction histidine kinase
MKPRINSSALLCPRNMLFIALAAVGLALVEAFIDAVTWVQLDVAAIYGLPLVLATLTRSRRLLWALTAALTIATFAVYAVQIPAGAFALNETFFVNRLFDAVAVLLTAGLLHVWIISVDTAEAQARLLKTQNDELEAANVELVRREEKIAHQNEELERRRREAEEASARKTQLLASASHDIRTPVNTINLMAEVIRRTAEDPALAAQVPKLAQRLQANALSLADLLSALLDTARLESGRVEYQESTFSLDALLVSTCEDLGPAAQAKTLQLKFEVPERAIWLRTDRVKLQRVISNLVSNAIKFTEHGTVTVTAALAANRVAVIGVQDTGMGIAPQQLERIFTEFAQVHTADNDGNSGWGLGLSICRRLVKLIGGRITVESELNEGSVFKVRLPPECVVDEPKDEVPLALRMKLSSYP